MTVQHLAAAGLLSILAAFALISAIGIVRSRNNFAALHCAGVTTVTLPLLLIAAVFVESGFGVPAVKAVTLAVIFLLGGPVSAHAIAVAVHRRRPQ